LKFLQSISKFSLLTNLCLGLLSMIVFFSVAEMLSRIKYTPQKISYPGLFEYDADKVYALKKNLKGKYFAGFPIYTNSFGYRDSEIPLEKGEGVKRVLLIGDSVTFGHGVSRKDTYSDKLERMLNQNFPNSRFDVINTAVPGNSPFQEFHDLKRGLKFDPDLVVIQFVLNDVVEPYKVFRRYGGEGIDYHNVQDTYWVDHALMQYSAFYLFLKDMYKKAFLSNIKKRRKEELKKARALDWNMAAREPKNEIEQKLWEECLKWLKKEVELCKSKNISIILFTSPVDFQFFYPKLTYAQKRLRKFAEENNILFLDILPALHEMVLQETKMKPQDKKQIHKKIWRTLFIDYDHYSVRGHTMIAEIIFPLITK